MSSSTRPSGASYDFQMPHVFVVPPEEEQQRNPPWCCFDADEQPENDDDFFPSHDTPFLDGPYPSQHSENYPPALLHRRIYAHQPRLRPTLSKKLEKKQRPEAIRIVENKPSRERDAREDSDVIEVVKVKRHRVPVMDLQENATVKRSRTLSARASQVLQSIKNVSKVSHKTHIKELWSPTENMSGTFREMQEQIPLAQAQTEDFVPSTPPKKGSLSRGSLRSISQMFLPAKSSRVESLFSVRVAPSAETHHTLRTANPSSLSYNNSYPSLNGVSSTFTTDDAPDSPVFPIPTMKRKPNTKLSVRDLHRLFSFSSSSTEDLPSSSTATTAPSSSACDVSMEEDMDSDAQLVDLDSPERKIASRYHQGIHTYQDDDFSPLHRLSKFSFETRLDSFQFDALSFDPEEFGVSKEEIALR